MRSSNGFRSREIGPVPSFRGAARRYPTHRPCSLDEDCWLNDGHEGPHAYADPSRRLKLDRERLLRAMNGGGLVRCPVDCGIAGWEYCEHEAAALADAYEKAEP